MKLIKTLPWILFFVTFTGCAGYRVGNIQGSDMQDVKTVYVPTVKNRTYEPGLPVMVTNAILRRLDNDGTFTSARQKGADAILEVEVIDFKRLPLRQTRTDIQITEEYEITLKAKATLTNLKTGKRIFTDYEVVGKSKYFVHGNTQESERQVLPMAADDLAYNLVKICTEGW
ncbi:MAG: LPS assembly lipoprotein LptE [Verrucomicrobiota bacterium]